VGWLFTGSSLMSVADPCYFHEASTRRCAAPPPNTRGQVNDLDTTSPTPPFQAGHAGSIPVTRSTLLISANTEGSPRRPQSTALHSALWRDWLSVAVEYPKGTNGEWRPLTERALPHLAAVQAQLPPSDCLDKAEVTQTPDRTCVRSAGAPLPAARAASGCVRGRSTLPPS